jgi:hypothetical protein
MKSYPAKDGESEWLKIIHHKAMMLFSGERPKSRESIAPLKQAVKSACKKPKNWPEKTGFVVHFWSSGFVRCGFRERKRLTPAANDQLILLVIS